MSRTARFIVVLFVWMAARSGAAGDAGWPSYNNGYDSQRFANLDQINTKNVAGLKHVCDLTLGENAPFQTGPLVVGDTMYLTTPHTTVAMNATTCAVLWRRVAPGSSAANSTPANRGIAYLDGVLFRGMPDGSFAAFDAKNGQTKWQVPAGDIAKMELITSAPIAWRGKVFAGLAIGDFITLRGNVRAWKTADGTELWRFYTVPEKGAKSWDPASAAQTGGGGQWTSYTLDVEAGELFVPVGNPAPDFLPNRRLGANLYTDSVVVLDAESGAMKWYFQATPHDALDHDIGAAPVLYTTRAGVPMFAVGSKNGYLYGIDRSKRAQAFKTAVTTISNDDATLDTAVCVCPGALGGVEWNGPAFDPQTHALYVGAVDMCMIYDPSQPKITNGLCPGAATGGWITAVDADSGKMLWHMRTPGPVVAGLTPTSGGLLFTGDLAGNLYALDKSSGVQLLAYPTGGPIAGGVITYSVDGRQYVATTSGNTSRTFVSSTPARVIVLALEVPEGSPQMSVTLPSIPAGGSQ